MSHETHHHHPADKPTFSFGSAIWFVLILAGLFIGAVNFINVMGDDEGHGGGHGATESVTPTREATPSQSLEGETGLGKVADDTTQHHGSNTAMDTTYVEGH